jgi:glycosyltransferase involved in cell wall biosynthesis
MNKNFVFHVLGMSFTATSRKFLADAHTQNIFNICKLLMARGHTVYHYGNYGSDPLCTEHVEILDKETMERLYEGDDLKQAMTGYFIKQTADVNRKFVQKTVAEIDKRKAQNHFLLGVRDPHEEIYRYHKDMLYAHHSVGHVGWNPKMSVYASEFVRNFRLSKEHSRTGDASVWTGSAVIPHFLDPDEFEPCYEPDDYFLYFGRITPEKGVQIAIDTCRKLDVRLCLAGQGQLDKFQLSPNVEYAGFIENINARNDLLRKARAIFAPTQVPEPFGMVVIEALMSGVPVITSDWGAFPETVDHGLTGYRCTTLSEYAAAANNIDNISRRECRRVAEKRFSSAVAGYLYQSYFERIYAMQVNGLGSEARSDIALNYISH